MLKTTEVIKELVKNQHRTDIETNIN